MTTLPLGMIIEGMVAVLLLITIGYCWMLNKRLQRLRADEQVLRATISELMTATEIAERAILGLKTTAAEADKTLGTRLKQAETMSHSLADQLGEGEKVFTRITQIAEAARSAMPARESAPHSDVYAAPPQTSAAAYAPQQPSYAPASHYGGPAAPEPEPERKRSRTSDIRSAAAEATARLEEFRRRKGAAA